MKEIVVHAELPLSPERVFELLYSGKEFYRKFHLDIDGDDCADIGDWEGDIRVGRFTTPLNAPALITSIIKTTVLRIQARIEKQIRTYHPDGAISVRSEPVVDIPGAERFPSTATVTYSPPPEDADGESHPPCRVEVVVTTACVGIWGLQGTIESMMVEKAHSSIQVWLDYTEKACAEEAQRIQLESQREPTPELKLLPEPEPVPESVKAVVAEVIEDQEGDRFYDAEAEVESDAAAGDKRRKDEMDNSEDTPDAKLRRMLEESNASREAPAGASTSISLQPQDTKDPSNAGALVVADKRVMDTFQRDLDSLVTSQDDSREAIKALARQLSSIERQLQSVRKALPEGGDFSQNGYQNGYHHGHHNDSDYGGGQDLALRSSRVSLPVAMAGAGIVGAVCGSLAVLGFIYVKSRSQSR
eukprot:jgi/Chlat1/5474/Chrsp36S05429